MIRSMHSSRHAGLWKALQATHAGGVTMEGAARVATGGLHEVPRLRSSRVVDDLYSSVSPHRCVIDQCGPDHRCRHHSIASEHRPS